MGATGVSLSPDGSMAVIEATTPKGGHVMNVVRSSGLVTPLPNGFAPDWGP